MFNGKKGKMDTMWVILLAIGGIYLIMNGGFGSDNKVADAISDINSVADNTVTFSLEDTYSAGTAVPDATRVFVNGNDRGLVADAGTIDVSPGDEIVGYGAENSSSYYTVKSTMTAEDKGNSEMKIKVCAQATSSTLTFLDEFGDANTNLTIVAGQDYLMEVRYKGANNQCYGNPEGESTKIADCFKYNTSIFENVELKDAKDVATPLAVEDDATVAAGFRIVCYENDPSIDGDEVRNQLVLETKDSFTIGGTGSAASDITRVLADQDYDLDADDLSSIYGYEDEDDNDLGSTTSVTDTISLAD